MVFFCSFPISNNNLAIPASVSNEYSSVIVGLDRASIYKAAVPGRAIIINDWQIESWLWRVLVFAMLRDRGLEPLD